MKTILEFPSVRGIQAGREYYVSMCPLGHVPKIFTFTDEALEPELRAQRQLNKGRVPEIVRYLVENPASYVFSAITASIDGDATFTPHPGDDHHGVLRVNLNDSRIILNDGQHRRAAIASALVESPALADETIAVVLFHDRGLERCQQMFADLNRYGVRPSRSLSVLYDHRDDQALVAKLVIGQVDGLNGLVEMEKSSLSPRSKALVTLSALYTATAALLQDVDLDGVDARATTAAGFWEHVAGQFPQWTQVREGELSSGQLRETHIHAHGVALHALGRVGNTLLRRGESFAALNGLNGLDWRREASDWDGRAVVANRMTKSHQAVLLTAAAIKTRLGVPLSAEEQMFETALARENA
ncbi:DNA sulfur modification protein DndB [Brevundimonas variabilis]|uniref:DNA sulfur modification protein DndB n=1 Tax=Brevundimonas variabilis TaxID=74312 RepID=A0A7W9FH35_9CAUL|nr:DNA sulfur modification protein DndB [Brevundimonas variabilis]MBB5747059.1 DNA sulfur modification protein DndB [Brevundimonas variabilis]